MNLAKQLLKMGDWRCTRKQADLLGVTIQALSMASTRLERKGLAVCEDRRLIINKGITGRPFRVFRAVKNPRLQEPMEVSMKVKLDRRS